jgi:type VI secretion system VgrG family protein
MPLTDHSPSIAQALGLPPGLVYSGEKRLYHLQGRDEQARVVSGLLVEAWSMCEALSELYELHVTCVSADARIDLGALLGKPLRLRTTLADGGFAWRSGLVAHAANLHTDGGLARYRFTLVPWLWLLGQRRHSAVWQERSASAVVDDIFAGARSAAEWTWAPGSAAFLERGHHPQGVRCYVAQYRQTDLAFACRVLAEEGVGWRIEEDDAAALWHRIVLFTDSTSCPEEPGSAHNGGIRVQRAGSQETSDTIQSFDACSQLQSALTTVLGWNAAARRIVAASVARANASPRTASDNSLNDSSPCLEDYDPAGTDSSATAAAAEHHARIRREASECREHVCSARSTVRSLRAGQTFRLIRSPLDRFDEPRRLLVTRVTSAGINNLPREMIAALARRMGESGAALLVASHGHDLDPDIVRQAGACGYANRFEAQSADIPWRPVAYPKAEAPGLQSAIVVGPSGQTQASAAHEIHRDALGRIKVRFHWQRGERADDRSSCWLRVAQSLAGAGVGSQFLPRIGQEVLVDFLDADIDQPVVRAALYNGCGEGGVPATPGGQSVQGARDGRRIFRRSADHRSSGQGNLSGGHAPAWHGGAADAQHNQAALSGIKTSEFAGRGHNQLVFDDSNAQLRLQLATTEHATQLNLGHLVHQADNHRGSLRGSGWELRSDAWGALRTTQGLLLSSYASDPGAPAGDNPAGQALARQMVQLAKSCDQAAKTHQTVQLAAHIGSTAANQSGLSAKLAPLCALQQVLDGMVDTGHIDTARQDAAHKNTAPANKLPYSTDPVIVVAARAALALAAREDIVVAAGEGIHLGAGQDSTRAVGGAARLHTGQAIGVLAGAVQASAGKAGDQAAGTGITLIAGRGDVQMQAQSDTLHIAAEGAVNVQSAHAHVDWAAAKKITLRTAAGASIVIEGAGITVQCSGTITVHAATKDFVGAAAVRFAMPSFKRADFCLECFLSAARTGSALVPA